MPDSNAFQHAIKTSAIVVSMIALILLLPACRSTNARSLARATHNDSSSAVGGLPRNLDDALVELDRIMEEDKGRADVLKATEDDMVKYHFGLGMWIRNTWIRNAGSPLRQYFNQLGIHHPDDMSGIILHSYWRKLHGKPIDLDGQVRYYQDYWKEQKSKQ